MCPISSATRASIFPRASETTISLEQMGSKRLKRTQRHFEGQGKEQKLPKIQYSCVKTALSSARPSRRLSRLNRNDNTRATHRLSDLRRSDGNATNGSSRRRNRHGQRSHEKKRNYFKTIYRINVTALAELGSCMTLSSWSTTSIEDVARSAPNGLRWFQLYVYSDRKATVDLIRRAESMGYEALALTVDTPVLGRRYDDVRNRFALPRPLRLENFLKKMEELSSGVQSQDDSGLAAYVAKLIDPSLNWETVAWLMSVTRLPIVLKGVLTGEDARKAVELGVAGIWVSNHGARQLDGVPATVQLTTHL